MEGLENLFQLPLSVQAYTQFGLLQTMIDDLQITEERDTWTYIWGSEKYSSSKACSWLIVHRVIHKSIMWLWSSSCQMKHKVFFWLLLKERINTRGVLKRRNMLLDDYTCEMCILQREETVHHLFLSCNFARACWLSIGIHAPATVNAEVAIQRIQMLLQTTSIDLIICSRFHDEDDFI